MILRPCPVQQYIRLMHSRGLDALALIKGTSIDLDSLDDPAYLIQLEDLEQFLKNMIQLSGDRGLGLEIGLQQQAAHYGILAYTGLSCHSISEGMEDIWSKYGQAFGVMSKLRVTDTSDDLATVTILTPFIDEPLQRFCVEEALCIIYAIGGRITGENPTFENLQLAYPRPSYSQRYEDVFNCPVIFGCYESKVSLHREWLDKPLTTSDAELNQICRQHLAHVLVKTDASGLFVQKLRQFLLTSSKTLPTLEEAAEEFSVSPRTLARKLSDEGYNYRTLTQDVRKELACTWLQNGAMAPKEISYRLGFSDVAVFRRAFKQWTGTTPGNYVRQTSDQ